MADEKKGAKAPRDLSNISISKDSLPVKICGDDGAVVFEGRIRSMSGADREEFFADSIAASAVQQEGKTFPKGMLARTICRCLFDAGGKKADEAVVAGWPCQVLDMLHEAALELSGLSSNREEVDAEAKKD